MSMRLLLHVPSQVQGPKHREEDIWRAEYCYYEVEKVVVLRHQGHVDHTKKVSSWSNGSLFVRRNYAVHTRGQVDFCERPLLARFRGNMHFSGLSRYYDWYLGINKHFIYIYVMNSEY